MKALIMRGLPGAGKSTWIARELAGRTVIVCSADDYFMVEGDYKFYPGGS